MTLFDNQSYVLAQMQVVSSENDLCESRLPLKLTDAGNSDELLNRDAKVLQFMELLTDETVINKLRSVLSLRC